MGVFCVLLLGCTSTAERPATVNHLVVFWLNDSGNEIDRQKLIETSRTFENIPGVLAVHAGTSLPNARKIADDSFDVALSITFANTNDLNAYLIHPIHEQARHEILAPLVKRIVVYDFQE